VADCLVGGPRPYHRCRPGGPGPCARTALEAALADPQRRPPGGWSARAEAWAQDRDSSAWREAEAARRARGRPRAAEDEGHALACELAARQGRAA